MWYYPKGVRNKILKYQIPVFSKWDIHYTTYKFKKSGDDRDLVYKCRTSEGVEVKFERTEDNLHVMDCSKYFGIGKSGMCLERK